MLDHHGPLVWIQRGCLTKVDFVLDPSNSVIKRFWCKCLLRVLRINTYCQRCHNMFLSLFDLFLSLLLSIKLDGI